MDWLIATIVYLGLHFLLYVTVLRNVPAFTTERVIFAYHCVSVGLLALASLLGVIQFGRTLAAALAAIGLHGLYSISFLELWSLAEGSYSITILRESTKLESAGQPSDVAALERVGGVKRAQRTDGLLRLCLVRRHDGCLHLTGRGRFVAAGLSIVDWTANIHRVS